MNSIRNWRKKARPGDTIVYHTGLLLLDRKYMKPLNAEAGHAWALNLAGLVALSQKRIREGVSEYRATATKLKPWVERERT
jgi:hypothetical protein